MKYEKTKSIKKMSVHNKFKNKPIKKIASKVKIKYPRQQKEA